MSNQPNLNLTLIEDKGYDIEDIKRKLAPDLFTAFNTWFAGKTGYISSDGKFCVFVDDFELWQRLRNKVITTR